MGPVRARLDVIAVRPIRADPEREILEEVVVPEAAEAGEAPQGLE